MIIEGKNAVIESLKSKTTTIEKVILLKGAPNSNYGVITNLCKDNNVPYKFLDKNALDRVSESGKHQGVIAFATEFQYCEMADILADSGKDKLIILLDGIEDPHNLGAIIRVAECAGADGIILPKNRCCGVTDTVIRVSSGATSYVKIAKVNNINDAVRALKEQNIFVYATDMNGQSIYRANLKGNIAFIIGGEGSGVHELTKKLSDLTVSLPQNGSINSLNASVATGIVVYEALRQRMN